MNNKHSVKNNEKLYLNTKNKFTNLKQTEIANNHKQKRQSKVTLESFKKD